MMPGNEPTVTPTDNKLSSLVRERGHIKANVTRFKTYAQSLNDTSNKTQAKFRLKRFEALWDEFKIIQNQIEDIDNSERQIQERELFESQFFELCERVDTFINVNANLISNSSSNLPHVSGIIQNNSASVQVKLPQISIPEFTGNYTKWTSFYQSFDSLIHKNESISNIQRFHYLKSSVKGEPATLIDSLEITDDNYSIALQSLKNRYDNKRLILKTHVNKLCNLPTITKNSASSLRQLINTVTVNTEALKSFGQNLDNWDLVLIELITSKLDYFTIREWESTKIANDIPTYKELYDFLITKCKMLEAIDQINDKQGAMALNNSNNKNFKQKQINHMVVNNPRCNFCQQGHYTNNCENLLKLSAESRLLEIKKLKLCTNCLREGHGSHNCKAKFRCRVCKRPHHSILHSNSSNEHEQSVDSRTNAATTNNSNELQTFNSVGSTSNHCKEINLNSQVLLSTAIIKVQDKGGQFINLRCLLDQGSQSNLISQRACDKLMLTPNKINIPISGINKSVTMISKSVDVKFKSQYNAFTANINCLVLSEITDNLPLVSFPKSTVNFPRNLKLADINFNVSSTIDILIGAEIFWQLLCVGQINTGINQPILQKTHLGWIIAGRTSIPQQSLKLNCNLVTSKLDTQLTKFWEINEFKADESAPQSECESLFINTHTRDESGRYIVKLPFKQNHSSLGDSKQQALKRFYSLERKFENNKQLKDSYVDFMNQYRELNHMELVQQNNTHVESVRSFYLPHHAVFKEESASTKIRVVFDGSAKTSSGTSLNDTLLIGPTIQQDLFSILVRFRTHQYAITADIAKMYRQILIADEDRDYQRILWRENACEPIQTYRLKTVTYGTAPASFLAIRSLAQLAQDEQTNFPLVHDILKSDFYVDDLLTGSNDLVQAQTIKHDLISLLAKGQFHLTKWSSNHPSLRDSSLNFESGNVNLDKQDSTKVLGLSWNYNSDTLRYTYKEPPSIIKVTKRLILSTIAKLFDPLGLIGPILVTAKILLQKLWLLKIEWDESVPINISTQFTEFIRQLPLLNNLQVDRQIINQDDPVCYEIHGFCDASQAAYGACIYLRTICRNNEYSSKLICAKSKIAPTKVISIPRLELCGALLLASLIEKVIKRLNLVISKQYLYTDSTIVLAWLASEPTKWKTFVANRVSKILSLTDHSDWHHVNTEHNPADIISRGTTPSFLIQSDLWWHGPKIVTEDIDQFSNAYTVDDIPEAKITVAVSTTPKAPESIPSFIFKFSDYNKLQRVIAYCLRFINNLRRNTSKKYDNLSSSELQITTNRLIFCIQRVEFQMELKCLKHDGQVPRNSNLSSLSPFIDNEGLIRVGGRLKNASIHYNAKHPILLPAKNFITKLLIKREHERLLHAGQQTTLASLRHSYWPLQGKDTVRQIIHNCIKCFRVNPKSITQPMGDLPHFRVNQARPFLICGVDFAGPIMLKQGLRKQNPVKAYIAVFVCLSTRAIHLELASNLTTECFLNALRRLIARRGNIAHMYSDNGTNFVGAKRQLDENFKIIKNVIANPEMIKIMSNLNITWHHIPPRAPHFGGIWEQGVKQVKHHLRRIVGDALLNFEEMYTLLTRIESILNSRPLLPLSTDPNDLQVLTPGHFLIGEPLTAPVEPDLCDLKVNRLSRWQHIEQLRQHFWGRWVREYLTQLQQRQKWHASKPFHFKIGMLVIIKDDTQQPLRWPLGRILQLHPGKDGIVRVVTLKTNTGEVRRPVAKLCVLPDKPFGEI